jgi:tryptophanyl-tRNA synthetase
MPPRPAHAATSALLLRGAFASVLKLDLHSRSVVASKSEKDSEILTLILAAEPSEEQVAKVFALANAKRAEDLPVSVVDVPRALVPADAFEFSVYDPPAPLSVVRLASIENWALSAIAHDGVSGGGVFCASSAGCGEMQLRKKKYNAGKKELSLTYTCEQQPAADLAQVAVTTQVPDLGWVLPSLPEAAAGPAAAGEDCGARVTPWEVEGVVDYDKLVNQFGSQKIDQALLDRFQRVTGHEPHAWLKRGIFFSHRDLDLVLTAHEKREPVYLYTGRGPSSEALHFGHLIPFMFTKWLQDVLDCPLVIQLTDDEKFLWKDLELDEATRLGYENAKDIMAVGFNPAKTFIFLNTEYLGHMYPLICEIQKRVTFNQVKGIFGFGESDSIGKVAFPAVQAAPSFSRAFPVVLGGRPDMRCLIPCAIDQDPYFRMTRDVASRLKLKKPCLVHSKFFPALQGAGSKMSGSATESAVMVTDDAKTIFLKIKEKAFSGGRDTAELQLERGADLEVDIAYQWLRFFLYDDAQLAEIARLYGGGALRPGETRMMTSQVKQVLVDILCKMAAEHQDRRSKLDQRVMDQVFAIRKLC